MTANEMFRLLITTDVAHVFVEPETNQRIKVPGRHTVMRALTLDDGTEISIQASRGHYCKPRSDKGPWSHVEVRFVSEQFDPPPTTWHPFAEVWSDAPSAEAKRNCRQFAWVPVELVEQYIHEHSGWWVAFKRGVYDFFQGIV